MAIRAGVPLVPLALIGTYELLPIHVYALRPRPLMIIVGNPIATEGLTTKDADELTQRMYGEISKMYYRYSDVGARAAADSGSEAQDGVETQL
jgi:1-acyl-sn-glycerol-3-phosphate acyltransferase